jgi:hypothetical protein
VKFFVKGGVVLAVKGVEFVIAIISHPVLGGRWFDDDDFPNKPVLIDGKISIVYWVVAYLLFCRGRRAKMQDDARNFNINTHGFYSQYLRRARVF